MVQFRGCEARVRTAHADEAGEEASEVVTSFGYTLSSEEHPPLELVRNATRAEDVGFDFASISDHFHPWVGRSGHSPFVWSVLGAIAASTSRLGVGVGVTCPIMRVHRGRGAGGRHHVAALRRTVLLGLGTGEALNEHVIGRRWPPPPVRREMLEEAVEIIRALFTGETVDHRGVHYEVDNARLFDPPADDVPLIISGFGRESATLAGRIGDGFWGTAPDDELVGAFEQAGGRGPRYAQLDVCWAPTWKSGAPHRP